MFFHFPLWSNLKCLRFYKFSACDQRGKLNFHFHSFQRHWVASHRLCPHCPSSDLYGMAWHGMVWYGMASSVWHLIAFELLLYWEPEILSSRQVTHCRQLLRDNFVTFFKEVQLLRTLPPGYKFSVFRFSIVSSLNSIAVWQFWQRCGGS